MAKKLCILIIFSVVAGFISTGLGYRSVLRPIDSPSEFVAIANDGWIANGSKILLSDLSSVGNRATLSFIGWRPAGQPPAAIVVNVCGVERGRFLVEEGSLSHTISLSGRCSPRLVDFIVENPFQASSLDQRQLGSQLESVKISSRLGVTVVDWGWIFLVSISLLFAGVIFTYISSRLSIGLLIVFSLSLLVEGGNFEKWNLLAQVWIVTCAFGLGLLSSRLLSNQSLKFQNQVAGLGPVLAAFAITAVAALIRFYGLDFGLPFTFHSDEPRKVAVLRRMVESGSLDPNYFLHPSLLLYLTLIVKQFYQWLGFNIDPENIYFVSGRTVSAIAGTVSVFFTFLIGRKLFSAWAGVLACLLLAVFPLHVTCSRYMKEDALLVCFILITTFVVLKAVADQRKDLLYLAGFFAGLAAGSKYTGMLAGLIVICAPFLSSARFNLRSLLPRSTLWKSTLFALLFMPAGFFLSTPYSVFNMTKFLADFGSEGGHMMRGHTSAITAASQFWMFHFGRSLVPGVTWFVAVVAIVAMGILVYQRRVNWLFIVGLFLMFYIPAEWVKAKPAPQPDRYILPCLPFVALALAGVMKLFMDQRWVGVSIILATVSIAFPALRSFELASEIRNDTRIQMAQWMVENLPGGSKIYINGEGYASDFRNGEFEVTRLSRTKPRDFEIHKLLSSGQEYLLISSLAYARFYEQEGASPYFRGRFNEIFSDLKLLKQIAPKFGTYGFHNPTLKLYSLRHQDYALAAMENSPVAQDPTDE